jgi:hypothetical protein
MTAGYSSIMKIHYALAAVLLSLAACTKPVERPAAPQPEPPRARAALATLTVQNMTAERVTILYRITTRETNEVAIGQVAAGATTELAPVPAAEPIVLLARNAAGAELSLPARTFAIDGEWTWQIPASARFTRPPAPPRS